MNQAATLSARLTTPGFSVAARSINCLMPASRVESPTLSSRTIRGAPILIAPPITSSPTCLSIGRLSPVSKDSSAWLAPSTISPSAGNTSPGFTLT